MDGTRQALSVLQLDMARIGKRPTLAFKEFLELASADPQRVLRSIFQLFGDMVESHVGEGIDEYNGDPESVSLIKYDCSRLLVEGCDNPFFADRLFANRFVRLVRSFTSGAQQNKVYIFEGPPGCGKSTFLNNLLRKFELYTDTREGQSFEVVWSIKENKDDGVEVEVPCPSHDHPILIIPKQYRESFLRALIADNSPEVVSKIFTEKEYDWVLKEEACTICKSIFWAWFDKLGSLDDVMSMVRVRSYRFDRRLSQGVSVFNPGDRPVKDLALRDDRIQQQLDRIFGPNVVKYVYSPSAMTNNGIYVLMDVKGDNFGRLLELHNVISEGVHKVGDVEERVRSIFVALMNPEDKKKLEEEKIESFQARIQYIVVPYILEVGTEVSVYRSIFGAGIASHFLPNVLDNFARVIVSSRMGKESPALKEWIKDISKYKKYCDGDGLLLRMAVYAGVVPSWVSEEDRRNLTPALKRKMIAEAEHEGSKGFSGRDSIGLFNEFMSRYQSDSRLVNMNQVAEFFRLRSGGKDAIPANFVASLVGWYDYEVVSQIKEALYFENKDQMSRDILNYLWAINYNLDAKTVCRFTRQEIHVTLDFLKVVGSYISGTQLGDAGAMALARDTQKRYAETVAQDPRRSITDSNLYKELLGLYARNLKEKVLQPFVKNENFKEAVKAFGTPRFKTFDTRIQEHVSYMIGNLMTRFHYTEQGAKEICVYALDKGLS